MSKNATSCYRVSDDIKCRRCKEKKVIKNGRTKNNKQQYFCKICCYRFIENYTYQAYNSDLNQNIIQLTKEGLGIRSTARILKISATTLSAKAKFMKSMNYVLTLSTRKIIYGWFMLWKRILKLL